MEDVSKRRRISFSLSKLECGLKKSTPGKSAYTCHFQQTGINETKIEKREFILKLTFSLQLPSFWFRKVPTFSAQRIYQSMMCMSIFTYCDYNSLGSLESRKRMIRSIEKRSHEVISPKCSQKNCDLRFLIIDNRPCHGFRRHLDE